MTKATQQRRRKWRFRTEYIDGSQTDRGDGMGQPSWGAGLGWPFGHHLHGERREGVQGTAGVWLGETQELTSEGLRLLMKIKTRSALEGKRTELGQG